MEEIIHSHNHYWLFFIFVSAHINIPVYGLNSLGVELKRAAVCLNVSVFELSSQLMKKSVQINWCSMHLNRWRLQVIR